MMKKSFIAAALALLGGSAFASNYYVVVPIPGKTVNTSDIQVVLGQSVLPAGQVGVAFSYDFKQNLQVTGDASYTGYGLTWSIGDGALPAGLVLDRKAGVLSGTPTASGTSTFSVYASYKTKNGVQSYQVAVLNVQVSLANGTPPTATVGDAYTYDLKPLLTVTGDANYNVAGVTWALQGTLPAGLSLSSSNGTISGTPTAAASNRQVDIQALYKNVSATKTFTFSAEMSRLLAQYSGYRAWADGTLAANCKAYRMPTDSHVYSGPTGDGIYRISLNGTPTDVYCDMTTSGGGWTLVRRTKPGGPWPATRDNASGTSSYGTYVPNPRDASTFSLAYSNLGYSDMLFRTGDGVKWVMAPKTSVAMITDACSIGVPVTASHVSATPYSVGWCLRTSQPEDPWISVYDHGYQGTTGSADNDTASMLYGEDGSAAWLYWLKNRDGANVFVR